VALASTVTVCSACPSRRSGAWHTGKARLTRRLRRQLSTVRAMPSESCRLHVNPPGAARGPDCGTVTAENCHGTPAVGVGVRVGNQVTVSESEPPGLAPPGTRMRRPTRRRDAAARPVPRSRPVSSLKFTVPGDLAAAALARAPGRGERAALRGPPPAPLCRGPLAGRPVHGTPGPAGVAAGRLPRRIRSR
jgi:hypothetical protein